MSTALPRATTVADVTSTAVVLATLAGFGAMRSDSATQVLDTIVEEETILRHKSKNGAERHHPLSGEQVSLEPVDTALHRVSLLINLTVERRWSAAGRTPAQPVHYLI